MGLLVATPAILWPLWQGISTRSRHALTQLRAWLDILWRAGVLLLLGALLCLGTAQVVASIPAAQA